MTSQIIQLKSRPPLKKGAFFLSNSNKIEVIITSLIEIPKLPKFGQMVTSTIKFVSRIEICW